MYINIKGLYIQCNKMISKGPVISVYTQNISLCDPTITNLHDITPTQTHTERILLTKRHADRSCWADDIFN